MHGEYKVPGGKLVVVDVETDSDVISSATVAGDFFLEPEEALPVISMALVGQSASASASEYATAIEYAVQRGEADGLLPGTVTFMGFDARAIGIAVRRALGFSSAWEDHTFEVIHPGALSPAQHCALDEVLSLELATGQRGPTLRFWEWEEPAVVIGSFQSFRNEVDAEAAQKHGITVVRRVSGGGAMFMEAGNCITFSLIVPPSLVDSMSFEDSYSFLDDWVIGALAEVGVQAKYAGLNDIASKAGKLAGAAQKRWTVGKGAVLHHVTMAYDIDADKMTEVLRIGREKLSDKGTKSANKRVDPVRSQTAMARELIIQTFKDYFARNYRVTIAELTETELLAADELVANKFSNPDWLHRIP